MIGWNWLDWVLVSIVAASFLAATWRGFVHELLSLASVVASLIVAALGYRQAAKWFEDLAKSHEVALAAGFMALFVGTLLIGILLILIAKRLIKTAGIQWFDRLLGGVFGLVRGIIVDSVLLMVLVAFAIKPDAVQRSVLSPYVATGARVVALAMPGSLRDQFYTGFAKLHQHLVEADKKAK